MAKAWAMIVLAFLPLVSGMYTLPVEPDVTDAAMGNERLIVLESGVWDSDGWTTLTENGLTPLRVVDQKSLLAWVPYTTNIPEDYDVHSLNDAVWKAGVDGQNARVGDWVRLVYEPRLPIDVKLNIADSLSAHGGQLADRNVGPLLPIPTFVNVQVQDMLFIEAALKIEGVLWIEPVLTTEARNGQSASIHEHGQLTEHPFWGLGLNGSGVTLGLADSGLDADHACFRNATEPASVHAEPSADYPAVGLFGDQHRKVLLLNTTLDENDTPGHEDYRHGTHVAGSLVCFDVSSDRGGTIPANGSALAHGAKLLMQDIVSSDGWVPPNVDDLLYESSAQGAYIHSNSWGDATTAYTQRTARFDGFAKAMPWSISFIAPGNSGAGILEPANGRNVISISATTKATDAIVWGSSSYGPTEAGTDGVFMLATGGSIQSAGADGDWSSNNNNLRSSSGTSMATPAAAGAAGVLQQMYQDGWLTGSFEPLHAVPLSTLQPSWVEVTPNNTTLLLGPGFTPSGSLMRATLALAATPLSQDERSGGNGGYQLHNPNDGWGRLNLSEVFDPSALNGEGEVAPIDDVWVHDSYRLINSNPVDWMESYGGQQSNLSGFSEITWDGAGAAGPFLKTGERFQQRFSPLNGTDVAIRLAYPAQPEPTAVDDLQLRITFPDGTVVIPDRLHADGTPTEFNGSIADFDDLNAFPGSNETTFGVNLPKELLEQYSYFDVEVVARYVAPGGEAGTVGLNGDRVGFGLVVQGVDRDGDDHLDGDGDGVTNMDDLCPNENALGNDVDGDGCLDDEDGDGVVSPYDDCPELNATGYDANNDGCIDDSDGDGVLDNEDECYTEDDSWAVMSNGCYPLDEPPFIQITNVPENGTVWIENFSVEWKVNDADGDGYRTGAQLVYSNNSNYTITDCVFQHEVNRTMSCVWSNPADLPLQYLENGDFVLQVFVETTNASPAASQERVIINTTNNITLEKSGMHDGGPNEPLLITTKSSPPLMQWTFVGALLAAISSFWWSKRVQKEEAKGKTPAPFVEIEKGRDDLREQEE
jgi:hypothetical protein